MQIRSFWILGLMLATGSTWAREGVGLERGSASQALPVLTQELYDAVAPGVRAPWLRYLSDRFEQIDETGALMNKKQFMDAFGPLPPGLSGTITIKNAKVSDLGACAFIRYDMDEHEKVFDQTLHVLYRATDGWRREQGRWRMISSQVMVLAQDPPAQPVNLGLFEDYVGNYSLSGEWNYRVERAGPGIAYGREGHPTKPMIPVADNVFVVEGDPLEIQYIFERGSDGHVQRLVERRKFADLQLMRVLEPSAPH